MLVGRILGGFRVGFEVRAFARRDATCGACPAQGVSRRRACPGAWRGWRWAGRARDGKIQRVINLLQSILNIYPHRGRGLRGDCAKSVSSSRGGLRGGKPFTRARPGRKKLYLQKSLQAGRPRARRRSDRSRMIKPGSYSTYCTGSDDALTWRPRVCPAPRLPHKCGAARNAAHVARAHALLARTGRGARRAVQYCTARVTYTLGTATLSACGPWHAWLRRQDRGVCLDLAASRNGRRTRGFACFCLPMSPTRRQRHRSAARRRIGVMMRGAQCTPSQEAQQRPDCARVLYRIVQ